MYIYIYIHAGLCLGISFGLGFGGLGCRHEIAACWGNQVGILETLTGAPSAKLHGECGGLRCRDLTLREVSGRSLPIPKPKSPSGFWSGSWFWAFGKG